MTEQEMASDILNMFLMINVNPDTKSVTSYQMPGRAAKECGIKYVEGLMDYLDEYGSRTHELQNMDRDYEFLQKVRQIIKNT